MQGDELIRSCGGLVPGTPYFTPSVGPASAGGKGLGFRAGRAPWGAATPSTTLPQKLVMRLAFGTVSPKP